MGHEAHDVLLAPREQPTLEGLGACVCVCVGGSWWTKVEAKVENSGFKAAGLSLPGSSRTPVWA